MLVNLDGTFARVGCVKLYAISDMHLDFKVNREALKKIPSFPGDWLITGGDLCTSLAHLRETLEILCSRFSKVFWVPGNHELWSSPRDSGDGLLQGEEKYQALVGVCRQYGVLTPEDPFINWTGAGGPCTIAPLFVPYDYTFKPDDVALDDAVSWAMESGVLCSDERRINPTPYASVAEWCAVRLEITRTRLDAVKDDGPMVLINHFPMRRDLIRLRRIPRFIIWCGTRETESWHSDYPARVIVSGHLHMRATDWRGGVRFEEVSLGYPKDWDQGRGIQYYFREILPGPENVIQGDRGPIWRFF